MKTFKRPRIGRRMYFLLCHFCLLVVVPWVFLTTNYLLHSVTLEKNRSKQNQLSSVARAEMKRALRRGRKEGLLSFSLAKFYIMEKVLLIQGLGVLPLLVHCKLPTSIFSCFFNNLPVLIHTHGWRERGTFSAKWLALQRKKTIPIWFTPGSLDLVSTPPTGHKP